MINELEENLSLQRDGNTELSTIYDTINNKTKSTTSYSFSFKKDNESFTISHSDFLISIIYFSKDITSPTGVSLKYHMQISENNKYDIQSHNKGIPIEDSTPKIEILSFLEQSLKPEGIECVETRRNYLN
jgi:hypothetical protein